MTLSSARTAVRTVSAALRRPPQADVQETGKVAHHKLARARGGDDHSVAVPCFHLPAHGLDGRHVLGDLRAQVGAVNHTLMAVGVRAVDGVPVESKGCACLYGGSEDEGAPVPLTVTITFGDARVRPQSR